MKYLKLTDLVGEKFDPSRLDYKEQVTEKSFIKNRYGKTVNNISYYVTTYGTHENIYCLIYGVGDHCISHAYVDKNLHVGKEIFGCIDKDFLAELIKREPRDNTSVYSRLFIKTYTPIISFLALVFVISFVLEFVLGGGLHAFLNYYMAFFFLIFGGIKFFNLKKFALSFSKYDPIAKHVPLYGRIYPFIEVSLGIFFLTGFFLLLSNILTIVILSASTYGIVRSILKKEHLECACLGGFFNVPIGPLTVLENVVMIVMALYMI